MRALLTSTSMLALLVTGSTYAAAQENDEPQLDIEEIRVFGQALSIQRAVDVKRNATNIVDATVQDDIGRLPDLNTASVIRRISGVAVQNDQAEARFPIIRGLNPTYNRTTVDGGIVSSPERGGNGRSVPLDVVPASLLGRLEVIKSVTPELDGNAIGGTINVATRSAFTEDNNFFYGAAYVGFHEQSGDGGKLIGGGKQQPLRANFATGTKFGADEQFGVVIGFDYSVRNFEIPQIEVDDADYTEFDAAGNNVGLGNGNGIVVPTNNRVFFYNNNRERIGGAAKLEWRPSATFEAALSSIYTEFNDDERRDEVRYELGTSGSSAQPDTITNQTPISGVTEDGQGIIGLGRFTLDRKIYNIQGTAEWQPSDTVTIDGRLTYSGAELNNPESTESFSTTATFGAVYDTSDFFPRTFPLDPEGYLNPASYNHNNRGELDRFAEDDIFEIALNGEMDFEAFTLKAGGVFRDRTKEEGFTFNRFVSDGPYTLANVPDNGLADVEFQGNYKFLTRVDSDAANQFFQNNAFTNVLTVQRGSTANEEILAGYVQGTYRMGDLSVTGGVRLENTSWDGVPLGGAEVSGDYTDVLPSAVLRYDLQEDVVWRLAASRTIGRPNLSDLTRGFSPGTDGADLTLSRSNPDLKPRRSTNIDTALEWYIPNGLLAIGAFYKDISDEIFVLTTTNANLTVDGVVFDRVTQPENAASAEVFGIEGQFQQTFTWLPQPWDGFGVSANFTILDTDFEIPVGDGTTRTTGLFQQPDLVLNLTAFYQNEYFEVRGSYNYTDSFLDALNAGDPNRDEYWDDRGQLDLQARVNVTENIAIVGEAVNLTNEGRTELTGPDALFLQEDARFGRTYWVGVTASF